MLDDLAGVIETLQGRIRNYGDTLRQNEIRTRVALIDPLLQALGWDVADPALATPEYEISGQRVDYALLGPEGKPAVTVEAKKLGEPLASHRMQMLNYSNAAGIAYAGLTDGNQWELYEVFKQVTLEERRLLDLRLLDTPAHECALKLLLLWRPNLATGRPIEANTPIVTVGMVDAAPAVDGGAQKPTTESFVPPVGEGWVRLSDFQHESGISAPSAIKFATGEEIISCQYWWQMLSEVAKWLIKAEKLTAGSCPIVVSGGKRHIIHTTPVDYDGKQFANPHQLSHSLYIERHGTSRAMMRRVKSLLQHCGVDAGQVWLKLG